MLRVEVLAERGAIVPGRQTDDFAGPGTLPLATRASRLVANHPEGYPEAFANLYRDAAETIAANITGTDPNPLALHFPTSADGLACALFIDAIIRSSDGGGFWTKVEAE